MKKLHILSNGETVNSAISFKNKILHVKQLVTVEPLIACSFVAHILCVPALEALEFDTACRVDAQYNDTVCEAILSQHHENYTQQNNHVQKIISNMYSWQFPIHSLIPIILVVFLGSYSDRQAKRRPLLILPFVGGLITIVGCIMCAIYKDIWSVMIQGIIHIIIPSFFGGPIMLIMGAVAYITDVSSLERRTFRIGVIFIIRSLCYTILNTPGGVLFQYSGYITTFGIAGLFYTMGLCYGLCVIKENKSEENRDMSKQSVFYLRYVLDTFTLFLRGKDGVKKSLLLYCLAVIFMSTVVGSGERRLLWLFTQAVYDWTPVVFSYNNTVCSALSFIGVLLLIPLFTTVFKFKDTTILLIAFADKIITNIVYIFVESVAGLYIAAVGSICSGITPVALHSLATKSVSKENVAKSLSLLFLSEALANMVSTPIYNQGIYNHTLESIPEAFFYFGIILLGLSIIITVCVRWGRIDIPDVYEKKTIT